MKEKLTSKQRLQMIEEAVVEGQPVNSVCKKYGISRVAFYRWKKRYQEVKSQKLKVKNIDLEDKKREVKRYWRQATEEQEKVVLEIKNKHPEFSIREIRENLPKNESGKPILGNHGIYNVLKRNNLIKKRKISSVIPLYNKEDKEIIGKPEKSKLSSKQRLEMIEKVVKDGEKVSQVCREYSISRVIFYRLKKRYDEIRKQKTQVTSQDLEDKKQEIKRYAKQASIEQKKEVIEVVLKNPEFSSHKIAELVSLGNHGVQNVLHRLGLNTYERRLAYQSSVGVIPKAIPSIPKVTPEVPVTPSVTRKPIFGFLTSLKSKISAISVLGILSFGLLYIFFKFVQLLRFSQPGAHLGLTFAAISLFFGMVFFIYSLKYYLTLAVILGFSKKIFSPFNGNGINNNHGEHIDKPTERCNGHNNNDNGKNWLAKLLGNGRFKNGNGHIGYSNGQTILEKDLEKVELPKQPFVSIHIPFYNEKRVANRILTACTNLDYDNYEVIVVDDSTDETTQILEKWKSHPKVKVFHRTHRTGFKGGALKQALAGMDPKTEFVIVFDADFIPYPE